VFVTYHNRTMVSDLQEPAAPHSLDLVLDFVNTLDLEKATDSIERPEDLAGWLEDRELLEPVARPLSESDHAHAVRLREALRALMLVNNGHPGDDQAGRELERAARRGDLGVHFEPTGAVSLTPAAAGAGGALARLLVPVATALADDTWRRVKACRAPDCRWAFYDRSRNRSGVWCDMAVCGNRTKVRTYREQRPRKAPTRAS
jgi:predicted RNA-binding Zn ribbon-like protein